MKPLVQICLMLALSSSVWADGVPRCWRSDRPEEDIQDGLFRVHISTAHREARELAVILGLLGQSLASQTGVQPSVDLEDIEIDVHGETKYWQPSAVYPTLDAWKTAIVNSMAGVLNYNVAIECARVNHHGK